METWRCNACTKVLTQDERDDNYRCPHCDATWCGWDCCGCNPVICVHAPDPEGAAADECDKCWWA